MPNDPLRPMVPRANPLDRVRGNVVGGIMNRRKPTKPTLQRLFEALIYNPETGKLTSKITRRQGRPRAGDVCEKLDRCGYVCVSLDGYAALGHRIAWALHYGVEAPGNLDHINGIRSDNRISNLRIATQLENSANSTVKPGASGLRGVTPTKGGRWQAQITYRYKWTYLGTFDTKEAASAAYIAKAKEVFGEFYTDRVKA